MSTFQMVNICEYQLPRDWDMVVTIRRENDLLSWCFRQSTAMIRSLHAHHASCCDVVLVMSGVWSDFGQGIHSCFLMFSGFFWCSCLVVAQTGCELLRRSWNFARGQAFCHSKQLWKPAKFALAAIHWPDQVPHIFLFFFGVSWRNHITK